ncbi:UNVERIFIED_CONTAM: hypothetical protein Slati_3706100 [Sesamum latifolium]|uniref:Reverse transcriptase zinc-binding domain-containing protein n=1 Tax=Sesamum latifolium TaxID=2727402 RepID=A0AAW2U2U0_9LAMI
MLATSRLVQAGSRWQIGNGHSVNIVRDRWIPHPLLFRILTAPQSLDPEAKVDVLITKEGHWNEELIKSVFAAKDAKAIINIAITGGPDTLRWHYERHGRFTTRSAFQLACREVQRGSTECGEPSSASRINWNFIWSAQVPPKVRVFAWRVCRNGLPTVLNLERRGVYTQGVCAWCGSEHEDIMHCLLRCSFPRQVWALSHLRWSIISQEASSPEAWLRGLHRLLDMESFEGQMLRSGGTFQGMKQALLN